MTPTILLEDLRRRGATASVTPAGKLRIGPAEVVDEALLSELRARRDEIIAEIRRREVGESRSCNPTFSEWLVEGCTSFTVLERAQEALEARYGACLSCGGSNEQHGSPEPSAWRRVASLDDVELVTARLVIASAAAIVRRARE